MNRNWTGKLQVKLFFAYISWKKFCSHTFKVSSEEAIVMRLRKWRQHSSWWRGLHLVFIKRSSSGLHPANIHLDEEVFKTSWRRLSSSSSEDVFKTSWSRRIYSPWSYVFRRRFQNVFKTSWSRLIYSSWPYVFKTSSRRLAKTSSRHLANMSSRRFQDVSSS